MKKALKWLDVNFEPVLIMVVFIIMTLLLTLQVILRFLFDEGFAWAEEFATFMFVWICFLGISYAFRNNRQITVAFIRDFLPEKARKILVLLIDFSMLAIMIIFLIGAISNVQNTAEFNDLAISIPITMNVAYAAALVGYSLSMLRIVQTIIWKIRRFNASFDLFFNRLGVYNNALDVCFMNKAVREDEMSQIDPQVAEEAKKYRKEG